MEPATENSFEGPVHALRDVLVDNSESPFDSAAHEEVRAKVEEELRHVAEPFRTTVILRDLEEMSYEEIAEVMQVTLGTEKSRLTRGLEALRQRLASYVREVGQELGLESAEPAPRFEPRSRLTSEGREVEVAS